MPITSFSSPYITYPYQIYDTGTATYETLRKVRDYTWRRSDNDKDSRVKPDEPLKNMTDLPLQYHEGYSHGSTGKYRWRTDTSSFYDREERKYSYSFPTPMNTSPPWPDWSLPLRLKIKDTSVNLGTSLVEYRQSVRMFGSAARGIADAWRLYRKTKKRVKRLNMCSVASAELVYTYGIEPLLSDVYDSMEVLMLALDKPFFKRFHLRQTQRESYSGSDYNWGTSALGAYKGKLTMSQDIACYVWFDLSKSSNFIFGNPLELAWEVVPFSFVVDWMIPIGDYLISLDALKDVKDVRVSVTRKENKYCEGTLYGSTSTGAKVIGSNHYPLTQFRKTHERTVHSTVPFPPLPKPEISGSVRRLLNATALLTAVRGCKGRVPRYQSINDV